MVAKDTPYTDDQIAEKLRELPGWYYEDGWIRRQSTRPTAGRPR